VKLTWTGDLEDLYECNAPHGSVITSILVDDEFELIVPGMALDAENLGPLSSARWTEEWFNHLRRSLGLPSAVLQMVQRVGEDDDFARKSVRKRHWLGHWKEPLSPESDETHPFLFRLTDREDRVSQPLLVQKHVRFVVEWEGEVPLILECPNPLDPA